MKSRRTHVSEHVFSLPGGTEDQDLWVAVYGPHDGTAPSQCFGSTWVPSDEERQAIADGANIELLVWGGDHPPVGLRLSRYTLGKRPETPAPTDGGQS